MKLTNKSAQPLMRSQYVHETGNSSFKKSCLGFVVMIVLFVLFWLKYLLSKICWWLLKLFFWFN